MALQPRPQASSSSTDKDVPERKTVTLKLGKKRAAALMEADDTNIQVVPGKDIIQENDRKAAKTSKGHDLSDSVSQIQQLAANLGNRIAMLETEKRVLEESNAELKAEQDQNRKIIIGTDTKIYELEKAGKDRESLRAEIDMLKDQVQNLKGRGRAGEEELTAHIMGLQQELAESKRLCNERNGLLEAAEEVVKAWHAGGTWQGLGQLQHNMTTPCHQEPNASYHPAHESHAGASDDDAYDNDPPSKKGRKRKADHNIFHDQPSLKKRGHSPASTENTTATAAAQLSASTASPQQPTKAIPVPATAISRPLLQRGIRALETVSAELDAMTAERDRLAAEVRSGDTVTQILTARYGRLSTECVNKELSIVKLQIKLENADEVSIRRHRRVEQLEQVVVSLQREAAKMEEDRQVAEEARRLAAVAGSGNFATVAKGLESLQDVVKKFFTVDGGVGR